MSHKDLYAFKKRRNTTHGTVSQEVSEKRIGHFIPFQERKAAAADNKNTHFKIGTFKNGKIGYNIM